MAVKSLRLLSGFGWDERAKVVTALSDVWDQYLAVHTPFFLLEVALIRVPRPINLHRNGTRRPSPSMTSVRISTKVE